MSIEEDIELIKAQADIDKVVFRGAFGSIISRLQGHEKKLNRDYIRIKKLENRVAQLEKAQGAKYD